MDLSNFTFSESKVLSVRFVGSDLLFVCRGTLAILQALTRALTNLWWLRLGCCSFIMLSQLVAFKARFSSSVLARLKLKVAISIDFAFADWVLVAFKAFESKWKNLGSR